MSDVKKKGGLYESFINKAKAGVNEFEGKTTGTIAKTMQQGNTENLQIRYIPLSDIYTEKQVREVNETKVLEYASTIRGRDTKQPLQPITVWHDKTAGKYLVIMGEHRFRAQEFNYVNHGDDFKTIVAVVLTGECPQGTERRRMQVQENIQHNPMSDIDIAIAVKEEMALGTFTSLAGAVEWLHLDGAGTDKSPATIRKTLSQVFSLLDDEEAMDLVEAVHKGEMKPYKAKEIHAERIKERKAKENKVVSMEAKRAADRIKELETELEKSKKIVKKIEEGDQGGEGDYETLDETSFIVDEEQFLAEEKNRQVDLEEAIEIATKNAVEIEAKAADTFKSAKPKAAAPARFSLDFDDALEVLALLDSLAQTHNLEFINYDPETINRKQWDSIIKDRLPEIIETVTNS